MAAPVGRENEKSRRNRETKDRNKWISETDLVEIGQIRRGEQFLDFGMSAAQVVEYRFRICR
jgi:hypothetical protein